jgi:NADH dehydrogenase
MAALSPAEIAVPIRSLLGKRRETHVVLGSVERVVPEERRVEGDFGSLSYDILVLAGGAQHSYFGKEAWEQHAPGLKTLEQATEIRRRVLSAFELAERDATEQARKELMTFVVVGGGPTGVELAGAIGEMSRYTLASDFKRIDPKLTRIVLIEAGARILPSFSLESAAHAARELKRLGVQVLTNSTVTAIDAGGVDVGSERIAARTVIWAAGVAASPLGRSLGVPLDRQGRVIVGKDLSVPGRPEIFVLGDQAHVEDDKQRVLPAIAPVAIQQGAYLAKQLNARAKGHPPQAFTYFDKGQMATIGRRQAVVETGKLKLAGVLAWWMWLFIHILYLIGFKNRVVVLIQWAYSYLRFARGARLIVEKEWRSYAVVPSQPTELPATSQSATARVGRADHNAAHPS